jgi:hypothetical protein
MEDVLKRMGWKTALSPLEPLTLTLHQLSVDEIRKVAGFLAHPKSTSAGESEASL